MNLQPVSLSRSTSTRRRPVAPVQLKTDRYGQLVIGVASQLDGAVPRNLHTFLVELERSYSKNLIIIGPPPYPDAPPGMRVLTPHSAQSRGGSRVGVGKLEVVEVELVHGRTGKTSRLLMVYDPAMASAVFRRRYAAALVHPRIEDCIPPIVLVGGTRVGGNPRTTVLEHAGGAWILQVGVFNPYLGVGPAPDRSYGGTIVEIDLNSRWLPVTARFIDYQH